MAWNEPGKGQDPWGGGGRKNGDGPPDLDQIWRRFRARLSKGGGNGSGSGGNTGGGSGPSPALLLWLIPVVAVIWLLTGFFVIQPGGQGVVLRFGNYMHTVTPGWHWYWPSPIGRVMSVDTQQVRSASTRSVILTKDESLAEIEVSVQYRIDNPMNYLFVLTNPDRTVEQVLKSAVREVVNTSGLDQVIQEGVEPEELDSDALRNVDLKKSKDKAPIANPLATIPKKLMPAIKKQQAAYPEIKDRSRALLPNNVSKIVQTTLDHYKAGVHVIAVNVSYAQPPEPVQSAFEEAIKAREAKERKKNLARAYARQILARTKGQKAQILAESKAYKSRKVAQATGDVARFTKLAQEFELAPDVTRRRLYLETMGQVLDNARLILTEQGKNGPVIYLPLPGMAANTNKSTGKPKAGQTTDSGQADANQDSTSASGALAQPDSSGRSDNLRSRSRAQ